MTVQLNDTRQVSQKRKTQKKKTSQASLSKKTAAKKASATTTQATKKKTQTGKNQKSKKRTTAQRPWSTSQSLGEEVFSLLYSEGPRVLRGEQQIQATTQELFTTLKRHSRLVRRLESQWESQKKPLSSFIDQTRQRVPMPKAMSKRLETFSKSLK